MLRYSHNAKVFGQPFEWKNTKKYKMMSMRFDTYRVDENIIFRNRNNTVTAFLMLHCSFKDQQFQFYWGNQHSTLGT